MNTQLYEIEITKELSLTPGDIVALAGDFFAEPDKPISFGADTGLDSKEARFKSSCGKLIHSPEKTSNIQKVVDRIREDAEAARPSARWRIRFVKKILDSTDLNNIIYGYVLADSDKHFWHSPYFKLAFYNFDHFGEEAKTAFLTGHKLACDLATKASLEKDFKIKSNLLKEALLHLLFACHYLTDLFASGHVRTPRKQILNHLVSSQVTNPSIDINAKPDLANISLVNIVLAGIFARKMHDEDNKNGVLVRFENPRDKNWLSFGDNNYYHPKNSDNAALACKTVLIALTDLVLAYNQKTTQIDKTNLSNYVPTDKDAGNEQAGKMPMFHVKNNQLIGRGDIVENIKRKGVIQGIKSSSVSDNALSYTYAGLRLFNVKVIPAGQSAATMVMNAGQTAAKKLAEAKDKTSQKVVETVQQVQLKTQEAVDDLYDKIVAIQPKCTFL